MNAIPRRVVSYDGDGNPIFEDTRNRKLQDFKERVLRAEMQQALSFYRLCQRALKENGVLVLPGVRYWKMEQLEAELIKNLEEK